jgi:LPS export ABC transporter protein LptC
MVSTADMDGLHETSRAAGLIATAGDRLAAFRKARRHTALVRTLKVALPLASCLAVATYAVLVLTVVGLRPKNFDPGTMRIGTDNLTMEHPKYDGFGKDGTRYQLRAKTAVTDLKMSGPVRLNEIDSDFIQQNGVLTNLKANWGTFDQKKNVLELYEKIDINGSNGTKARLTRATVYTKENRVISDEPVTAELQAGTVEAKTMTLNSKSRQITFKNAVKVHLKPAAPKPATAPAPAKQAAPLLGLDLNSGAPVDITSDVLDVDDNAHTALFRQNVVAKQGEATLRAPELDALYEGQATAAVSGQTEAQKTAPQDAAAKLKTLKARGGVIMDQKDDHSTSDTLDYDAATGRAVLRGNVVLTAANDRRATSAVAEFDRTADTALLTGDVVVMQGKNVVKGRRVFSERKTGKTRVESPAEAGQPAGRIAATFYRAEPKPGEAQSKAAKPATPAQEATDALFGGSFKTDPTAPIDVDADTLDVLDQSKQAVFKGTVVAKQGNFVVRTPEMTALYTGQSGLGVGASTQSAASDAKQGAQITKIEARQRVVITSADGRTVTGDWADFNVKANTAVVGGKVVVSQGKSVVEGTRLLMDMNTGQTHFENEGTPGPAAAAAAAAAGAAGAATSPTCPEGQICSKGRIRAVFYPKEMEAAKKKKDGEQGAEQPTSAQGTQQPKQPAASSWQATTRPPGSP